MTNKNEIPIIISTALAAKIAVDGGAILGAFIGAVLYVTITRNGIDDSLFRIMVEVDTIQNYFSPLTVADSR